METGFRRLAWLWIAVMMIIIAGCGKTDRSNADALSRLLEKYPLLSGDRLETGQVKRVIDGDTFELASGEKVRLIGVNTPEIHGQTEHYGKEAAAFAERELTGRSVYLFRDVSDRDRYGRLLRYVFVEGDEVMFNERLLREGYAQVMTVSPDVLFADAFVALQREARARQAGLWAASGAQDDAGAEGKGNGRINAGKTGDTDTPPPCPDPIKGNINSRGDKIYHVPGGRSYEATKPEQWFCSEEEAIAAGFRKASR